MLSLLQGLLVALPAARRLPLLGRLRSRLWALIPGLSVLTFVFVAGAITQASTKALTYLALVAVPILAAVSLGWLGGGARPRYTIAIPVLFALAWMDNGGLAGETAAVSLSALSCVALGVLLASVTPPRWLALGILVMALTDSALVISDLLQAPNDALNAAHPAGGLPLLQSATFGSAVMGYGDLFVAGLFGGLLAFWGGRRVQLIGAALVGMLALAFDLLFFVVNELPATVPVALALIVLVLARRAARPHRLPAAGVTEGGRGE